MNKHKINIELSFDECLKIINNHQNDVSLRNALTKQIDHAIKNIELKQKNGFELVDLLIEATSRCLDSINNEGDADADEVSLKEFKKTLAVVHNNAKISNGRQS